MLRGKDMSGREARWLLLGSSVLLGVTMAFLLESLHRTSPRFASQPTMADVQPTPIPAASQLVKPVPLAKQILPWDSRRQDSPSAPEYIPAWKVNPPRPDPNALPPPRPVEPTNPQLTKPPRDNPGGVNGDRPERPVPGMR